MLFPGAHDSMYNCCLRCALFGLFHKGRIDSIRGPSVNDRRVLNTHFNCSSTAGRSYSSICWLFLAQLIVISTLHAPKSLVWNATSISIPTDCAKIDNIKVKTTSRRTGCPSGPHDHNQEPRTLDRTRCPLQARHPYSFQLNAHLNASVITR